MRDSSTEMVTHRRRRNNNSPLPYILIIGCVAITFFAYLRYQSQSTVEPKPTSAQQNEVITTTKAQVSDEIAAQSSSAEETQLVRRVTEEFVPHEIVKENQIVARESVQQNPDLTRMTDFENLAAKVKEERIWADHQRALTNIELFYSNLDNKGYLIPLGLSSPSKAYFSSLIQKLLDNPPIVTGETDDLFNLLQNTAHFFRIVGKNNITLIKAILSKEKDSFEEVLLDYYTLTHSPEYLSKGFAISLDTEALYDYAGFFLTTMGGRLYLFRRDSVSRMVISYYSIRIIDEANQSGTNRHGIDIRPAVSLLINELENSGAQLKLKDYYLDTLYDIKERYL